jgi:hypothetical protein
MNNDGNGFTHDDPNRGPLDRAANAVTGGTGGIDAAIARDDPNRGPLDRTVNAVTGSTGGVDGELNRDDPNRGLFDRTSNALAGETDRLTTDGSIGGTLSAIFDTRTEAERAVAELRDAGVDNSALSVIARNEGTTTARDGEGTVTDEHHESLARGILGGGALGAGLGVLALAIPGVGPLVAAGAIAASAVPGAMAIGAVAGAAAGSLNETLKAHGVSDEDADYYGERLTAGGVLVTVTGAADSGRVREILRQNGGHSVNSPRLATA